jgi:regulator of sirC expression with transglutaminase-like and TPR domain
VLDSKRGNAVSVGIIYQILANQLNLPVYGVPLTQHYILAFCKKMFFNFDAEKELDRQVMFYINPINRGSIFSRNEIKDYIEKMQAEQSSEYFSPVSVQRVIKEMLNYLITLHANNNEFEKKDELTYLKNLFEE